MSKIDFDAMVETMRKRMFDAENRAGGYACALGSAETQIKKMERRISGLKELLRTHARRVACPACGGVGSRTCSTCDNGAVEHMHPDVMTALEEGHISIGPRDEVDDVIALADTRMCGACR